MLGAMLTVLRRWTDLKIVRLVRGTYIIYNIASQSNLVIIHDHNLVDTDHRQIWHASLPGSYDNA